MEALGGLLGGLGVFGVLVAFVLGFLIFLVIPIWAIFDCAYSKRDGGTKALVIILLILSWGVGSLIYSAFFSSSTILRRSTILAIVGVVLITVLSFISLMGGAKITSDIAEEKSLVEQQRIISEFNPETIDKSALDPFKALHFVQRSASAAEFTLAGPNLTTGFNIDSDVRHLIHDSRNSRYYGLTQHDFGVIDPATGHFEEIEVDPAIGKDFSWPKGLAFNPEKGEVVILSSHVDNKFFIFNPETREWKKTMAGSGHQPLIALVYSPDDKLLYALEETKQPAIASLRRFNLSGAEVGSLKLTPAVPITGGQNEYFQLAHSSGRLVLIAPPVAKATQGGSDGARIFVIDPGSGKVFVPAT